MSTSWLTETPLTSDLVTLMPLRKEHAKGLVEAASDGELWNLWFTSVPSAETVDSYIEKALQQQKEGTSLPFVIIDNASQTIIGCTRICNAIEQHKRVEIGYTWYAKRVQRTAVNSQCKLLLLQLAFETLGCIAVEFKTHWHNVKSRAAIARLGAKQDAVLRNHQIGIDGIIRDTVIFSIIQSEWPAVKQSLSFKINN